MKTIFLLFFFFSLSVHSYSKDIIVISNPDESISEKEAMLILPGFGDKKKRRKIQKKEFTDKGYDLFIPDYIDRKSFDQTVKNIEDFMKVHRLGEYKKLHCFTYIMGTWVLNTYINNNGFGNIKTIISDRSPLQERAPAVVRDRISLIGKLWKGPIINEFSHIEYPQINNPDSVYIGLIIENKATPFIRLFKKQTLKYGKIEMNVDSLKQANDDYMYTYLHHSEMYFRFDVVGFDIHHFVDHRRFSAKARNKPYDFDLFSKYKP